MPWTKIVGVLMILYSFFVIARGRFFRRDDLGMLSKVSAADNPFLFWLVVGGLFFLGDLIMFGVIKF